MCSLRTIKYKHLCSIWIMTVCVHQYSCFQCISGICTARKPTNATGIRIRCQQLSALGYQTLQAEIRVCAYPTCSYIRITMIRQLLFCYCCGKTQGQKIRDLSLVKGNRGKKLKKTSLAEAFFQDFMICTCWQKNQQTLVTLSEVSLCISYITDRKAQ